MGWWWHTEQDTIDKVEVGVLEKDVKIYALAAYRLCTCGLLPLRVSALARELSEEVAGIAHSVAGHFDLSPALSALRDLGAVADRFDRAVATMQASTPGVPAGYRVEAVRLQTAMLEATKMLTPVRYSPVDRFDHGPAVPTKPVPALQPAARLSRLGPESDEYRFLKTSLRRRQNAVVAQVATAARVLEQALLATKQQIS